MLRPGAQLDRFVLVELVGEGGQGAVWKALDPTRPGEHVALKLARLPAFGDAEANNQLARMRREAHALSQLSHRSLVRCRGLFEDYASGVLGLVLEWVDGQPLSRAERDPRMTYDRRLDVLRHVAYALAHLHESGLVHRDIKFANILVTEQFFATPKEGATVKVVDLGIVVATGNPQPLTEIGGVVGTEPYLAPEAANAGLQRGAAANPAADVFAFGVLGWRLLTRQHPSGLGFKEEYRTYFLHYCAAMEGKAPFPVGRVEGFWGAVLHRCLALRLDERPLNGSDIVDALEGATLRLPPSMIEAHLSARASAAMAAGGDGPPQSSPLSYSSPGPQQAQLGSSQPGGRAYQPVPQSSDPNYITRPPPSGPMPAAGPPAAALRLPRAPSIPAPPDGANGPSTGLVVAIAFALALGVAAGVVGAAYLLR